jgi:hypothetical protein
VWSACGGGASQTGGNTPDHPLTAALSAVASDGSSYVAMDGSNHVASTWDVPDMGAFQAAQRSFPPDLAAAAELAGMIPPVMIYIKK